MSHNVTNPQDHHSDTALYSELKSLHFHFGVIKRKHYERRGGKQQRCAA